MTNNKLTKALKTLGLNMDPTKTSYYRAPKVSKGRKIDVNALRASQRVAK